MINYAKTDAAIASSHREDTIQDEDECLTIREDINDSFNEGKEMLSAAILFVSVTSIFYFFMKLTNPVEATKG